MEASGRVDVFHFFLKAGWLASWSKNSRMPASACSREAAGRIAFVKKKRKRKEAIKAGCLCKQPLCIVPVEAGFWLLQGSCAEFSLGSRRGELKKLFPDIFQNLNLKRGKWVYIASQYTDGRHCTSLARNDSQIYKQAEFVTWPNLEIHSHHLAAISKKWVCMWEQLQTQYNSRMHFTHSAASCWVMKQPLIDH